MTLVDRIDDLRAQLETKQAEANVEREQRLKAEDRVAKFRDVANRLKERVTGFEDEELQALLAELEELEGEKKAAESLAEGVTVLADDLEEEQLATEYTATPEPTAATKLENAAPSENRETWRQKFVPPEGEG